MSGPAEPHRLTTRRADSPADDFERDLHTEHQVLHMGPAHPATHGTVKFLVELDGETIVGLDVQVGYLHRGFEKECESGTWYQAIPYTDRLNYASAILANVGFCLAVEKMLGLEVPRRCAWLRVMAGELSRVADHLTRCGAAALELGAMTPFLYGVEARELVWDLLEVLCGARVTSNYVRIGGVKHGLPPAFPAQAREILPRVRGLVRDFDAVVTRNRIFVDRLRGTGVISKEDCLRYAVTGPILRSAGVGLDVRWPAKERVFNHMEELIGHFKSVTEGPRVPAGETYLATESANGELGFYLVSDGSAVPVKVRCRPPSFINLAPLPLMVKGSLLADLIPTFDFVNMIGGECDR